MRISAWQRVRNHIPLFHLAAVFRVYYNIFAVNKMVLMKSFDAELLLKTIEKEKTKAMGNPPTVYKMLLQTPDLEKYDLSSINQLVSRSESIEDETRNQLKKFFSRAGINENYGITECTGALTARTAEHTETKSFSVGNPLPNTRVRIVDEKGNDVPPGTVGETIGMSPSVMQGYYNDPEKAAEAIRDGWLYTGDLDWVDEDGFFYIEERKNHMIISGENIYPKEIEEVLYKHPKIVEAAIFRLKDELFGQKVCASVILKPGAELSAEEVVSYCKENMAGFKKPKEVFFKDALPKSPVGKILRAQLKKQHAAV